MKRQRIKYKNKQVSTYKNYYTTQMIWQGTKVGTYILVFIMAPFGSVKKKGEKKISFKTFFNNIYKYHYLHAVCL